MTSNLLTHFLQQKDIINQQQSTYNSAGLFPYIAIDDFLPVEATEKIVASFPDKNFKASKRI